MRSIIHRELGKPEIVLRVENGAAPVLPNDHVRIRTTFVPIHHGDLLGVEGSPAFGAKPQIGVNGRVPGFEGAGVIEEIGSNVDSALGLRVGSRVIFFPANGAWRDEVHVPATSVVLLPDAVSDQVGAQLLANMATALTVIRTAHDSIPPQERQNVVTVLTGAGSAVGRLIHRLLTDRGVKVIRVVRSVKGAKTLEKAQPGETVLATERLDWKDSVREAAGGREIFVAVDSVGGPLLSELGELLVDGKGTVVNFGSLAGAATDIRSFPPRSLTLKGVVLGSWMKTDAEERKRDIQLALQLAERPAGLFDVAAEYFPEEIADAVSHMHRPGRTGAVLVRFSASIGASA